MSDHDPTRLLDGDGGAPLRSLLAAGRSEVPDEAQLLALAAKLAVLGGVGGAGAAGAAGAGGGVGAGGGAGGAGAVGAATVKAAFAVKVIAAVVAIGAAGTGAVVVSQRTSQAPTVPVGMVATVASAGESKSAGASASPSDAPSASASSATSARNVPSAPVRDEGPQAEVKLLEKAQDALRTQPAEALVLCNDHAKRFPNGMLVQEREVIAIEALVKTGKKSEARSRADRFEARFPGSSHTRRLESLLAN